MAFYFNEISPKVSFGLLNLCMKALLITAILVNHLFFCLSLITNDAGEN